MRGGKGTKGGDPPEEPRKRGAYRGEEEEREVAHRVRFRKLDTEDAGAGRHRRLHFLGYPSSNVHHQCHDVLRRSTVDQEVFRKRARWKQETSHVRWWARSETWRRLVETFFWRMFLNPIDIFWNLKYMFRYLSIYIFYVIYVYNLFDTRDVEYYSLHSLGIKTFVPFHM